MMEDFSYRQLEGELSQVIKWLQEQQKWLPPHTELFLDIEDTQAGVPYFYLNEHMEGN